MNRTSKYYFSHNFDKSTTFAYKDEGNRKFEFVAKTQFLSEIVLQTSLQN